MIMMKSIGIFFVVVGLVIFFFTGLNSITKNELVGMVSIEIGTSEKVPFFWPPITGSILVLVGGLTLFINNREKHPMHR